MRVAIFVVGGLFAAALIGVVAFLNPAARVGAAYVGKTLCSEVFVAGRSEADIRAADFAGINPLLDDVAATVDRTHSRVVASLFGLGRAEIVFRKDHGCTIVAGGAPAPLPALPAAAPGAPWPIAHWDSPDAPAGIDRAKIDAALDAAMADQTAATRALFIVVDGQVVGARFRDGFSAETPLLSWSMAKSVTATLVGAAAARGWIDVTAPAPVPEWKGDPAKSRITWNDLLRMQSGLAFSERYADPASDASRDLFVERDAGAYAASRPVAHPPGAVWSYSSGTTNLVARTLRQTLASRGVDYGVFAREAVFGPIGAASFVMEPDSSGTPIGSSYIYATAGDWARLGALYLDDGVAGGVRVLPEGWAEAATRAEPAADGQYGLQIWLNRPGASGRKPTYPGVPENMYYFSGHEGQFVYVIPDRRMIVVRAGITRGADPEAVVGRTLAALVAAVDPRTAAR